MINTGKPFPRFLGVESLGYLFTRTISELCIWVTGAAHEVNFLNTYCTVIDMSTNVPSDCNPGILKDCDFVS